MCTHACKAEYTLDFLQLLAVLILLGRLKTQLPFMWAVGGAWGMPVVGPEGRVPLQLLCTDARWWAGLPEESVLNPHTADLRAPLQGIARVTLEHRGVASFPTVTTPAAILWDPRVIARCGCGHWDKKIEEEVGLPAACWTRRLPCITLPDITSATAVTSVTSHQCHQLWQQCHHLRSHPIPVTTSTTTWTTTHSTNHGHPRVTRT